MNNYGHERVGPTKSKIREVQAVTVEYDCRGSDLIRPSDYYYFLYCTMWLQRINCTMWLQRRIISHRPVLDSR